MTKINHLSILGAGTMGGGIAGICANAGCQVLLLDLNREDADAAKTRLAGGRTPVSDATALARITTGSLTDNLADIKHSDLIIEAVVEDLAIKRKLFTQVEAARSANSLLATNTSGIPLRDITAGLPPRLRQDIAVTHFFNPPHLMKLVELVPGEDTAAATTTALAAFLGERLGKGVVHAKDTVNFIGNRIGCLWMLAGLHLADRAMREDRLTIETIDALTSAPLGLPPTGLYGLIDLVGLDVMHSVGKNLAANLPTADFGRKFTAFPPSVQRLLERGQLGRKTGGGFYQLTRHDDGSKSMQVFDLTANAWRPAQPATLPAAEQTLPALFAADTANGRFTRDLVATTLCYAADLLPEIADDIVNIDRAMRWGFNWQRGPFEMLDLIGADNMIAVVEAASMSLPAMLQVLQDSGEKSFYRHDGGEYLTTAGKWAAL